MKQNEGHTIQNMPIGLRPKSVKELASRYMSGEESRILYGDFLDAFYAMSYQEKARSLAEEPIGLLEYDQIFAVTLAATVEELAESCEVNVPSWVTADKYYLSSDEAMFGVIPASEIDEDSRQWFKKQSPKSFTKRNIFVSSNALARA